MCVLVYCTHLYSTYALYRLPFIVYHDKSTEEGDLKEEEAEDGKTSVDAVRGQGWESSGRTDEERHCIGEGCNSDGDTLGGGGGKNRLNKYRMPL